MTSNETSNKPSKIPYIYWDETKCQTPMACKICFQGCPTAVFLCWMKPPWPRGVEFDINEPGKYFVYAEWVDRCSGCMWCIERCPTDALKIEFTNI